MRSILRKLICVGKLFVVGLVPDVLGDSSDVAVSTNWVVTEHEVGKISAIGS